MEPTGRLQDIFSDLGLGMSDLGFSGCPGASSVKTFQASCPATYYYDHRFRGGALMIRLRVL